MTKKKKLPEAVYRTTDEERWGKGLNHPLELADLDANVYALQVRLDKILKLTRKVCKRAKDACERLNDIDKVLWLASRALNDEKSGGASGGGGGGHPK